MCTKVGALTWQRSKSQKVLVYSLCYVVPGNSKGWEWGEEQDKTWFRHKRMGVCGKQYTEGCKDRERSLLDRPKITGYYKSSFSVLLLSKPDL